VIGLRQMRLVVFYAPSRQILRRSDSLLLTDKLLNSSLRVGGRHNQVDIGEWPLDRLGCCYLLLQRPSSVIWRRTLLVLPEGIIFLQDYNGWELLNYLRL
jgi:hypothetical protein